jgi:outer membrane protein OmpA-like peptidoglycan-associated protein
MADSAKQYPGTLLRRGIGCVVLALIASCASQRPSDGYRLANGGRPLSNPQGVCVQIGPMRPGTKPECYQLAQTETDEHVEPLPLDEFGYLFPPLKPKPQLAPVTVPLPAMRVAAAPAQPLPTATSFMPVAPVTAPQTPTVKPAVHAAHYATKLIHFSTHMPFKLNSAHLSRANRAALTAFINSLEQYRGVISIRVTGHTDHSGTERFNQWLSLMRAKSVQLRLLSLGLDPRSIQLRGVGSSQPRPHTRHAADNRYVAIEVVMRVPAK